jgi:hypothetical protein
LGVSLLKAAEDEKETGDGEELAASRARQGAVSVNEESMKRVATTGSIGERSARFSARSLPLETPLGKWQPPNFGAAPEATVSDGNVFVACRS